MVDRIVPHRRDAAETFACSVMRRENTVYIHVEKKEDEKKEGWKIIEDSPLQNFSSNFHKISCKYFDRFRCNEILYYILHKINRIIIDKLDIKVPKNV